MAASAPFVTEGGTWFDGGQLLSPLLCVCVCVCERDIRDVCLRLKEGVRA